MGFYRAISSMDHSAGFHATIVSGYSFFSNDQNYAGTREVKSKSAELAEDTSYGVTQEALPTLDGRENNTRELASIRIMLLNNVLLIFAIPLPGLQAQCS
jgi:hypothetical protein